MLCASAPVSRGASADARSRMAYAVSSTTPAMFFGRAFTMAAILFDLTTMSMLTSGFGMLRRRILQDAETERAARVRGVLDEHRRDVDREGVRLPGRGR